MSDAFNHSATLITRGWIRTNETYVSELDMLAVMSFKINYELVERLFEDNN